MPRQRYGEIQLHSRTAYTRFSKNREIGYNKMFDVECHPQRQIIQESAPGPRAYHRAVRGQRRSLIAMTNGRKMQLASKAHGFILDAYHTAPRTRGGAVWCWCRRFLGHRAICEVCDSFAADGYEVIAPNFYDRWS
jgi:hypothetical protein